MTDAIEFLPRSGPVDRGSFVIAALAAPVVLGIGGAIFVLPPFAVWWGLPAYLLLGLPMFWMTIKQCPDAVRKSRISPFIVAGFVANLATYPLYFVGYTLAEAPDAESWALLCFGFGMVFAPLHGLVFGMLYRAPGTNQGVGGRFKQAFTTS